jgi:hypothetical protein
MKCLGRQLRRLLITKNPPRPAGEILDYYFATRGTKGLPLREVKLIVVGRGGAGRLVPAADRPRAWDHASQSSLIA